MSTATRTIHDEVKALILGATNRLPEHDGQPPEQVVADPTVPDLERIWGLHRDEWDLLGPEAHSDEPLGIRRYVERGNRRQVYYQVERLTEEGERYAAIDRRFTADEIGVEVFRDHGIHPHVAAEQTAIINVLGGENERLRSDLERAADDAGWDG